MARSNNSEALGLLEGEDDLEKTRVINIKTPRNSFKFFPVALYFIFGVLGFALGRLLPASDVYVGEAESVSPGRQEVRYRSKVFDQGYGENTTDGKRVYYAGPPSPEIDAAWNALEDAKYLRITEDEMRQLREPTAALHVGGGYLLSFDTYHQLHCLNYIRMALEPEYYSFEQSPEALKHHIAHCINDLRQTIQCNADITPMTFTPTVLEGKPAYDPNFQVRRTCRNWDRIHSWALERSVYNGPDIDLVVI